MQKPEQDVARPPDQARSDSDQGNAVGAAEDSIIPLRATDNQPCYMELSGAEAQDDLCAALADAMPLDTNIEHVLDQLTTSTNLFDVPELDF